MARSRPKFRIKKGDQVTVLTGRDKGKTGEVLRIISDKSRALVQGVNMVKRHQRPSQQTPGGISEFEAPIHISNIAVVDPKEGSATRVGYRRLEDGRKIRFARRSGEDIDG